MNIVKTLQNKTSSDHSAKAGYCVEFDTSGQEICNAITDPVTGIIVVGGATESDVCLWGECAAICGGTILRGQRIGSHTDGTVVASASSGCQDIGIALEGGVAGDWIQVFLSGTSKTFA